MCWEHQHIHAASFVICIVHLLPFRFLFAVFQKVEKQLIIGSISWIFSEALKPNNFSQHQIGQEDLGSSAHDVHMQLIIPASNIWLCYPTGAPCWLIPTINNSHSESREVPCIQALFVFQQRAFMPVIFTTEGWLHPFLWRTSQTAAAQSFENHRIHV